ncbi:MAG: hypothetical protein R6T83_07750 [Salinibacter sp.]
MPRLLPRPSVLAVLATALFLLPLAGCDSGGGPDIEDEDPPSLDNAFSLDVTDEDGTTRTLDGFAYFATGTDPETNVQGFVIYFLDDEDFAEGDATDGLFGLAVRQSGRPATGQYAVSTAEDDFESGASFAMVLYENLTASSATIYEISGGSIDVTRSESSRIDGSLALDGVAIDFGSGEPTERPVTIDGVFQSPGVSSFFGTTFLP